MEDKVMCSDVSNIIEIKQVAWPDLNKETTGRQDGEERPRLETLMKVGSSLAIAEIETDTLTNHGIGLVSLFNGVYNTLPIRAERVEPIIEQIRSSISLEKQVAELRRIYSEGGQTAYKESPLKKQLPAVTFSCSCSSRSKEGFQAASGLSTHDIDGLENLDEAVSIRNLLAAGPHAVAVYVSPSGRGVRALLRVPRAGSPEEYGHYWHCADLYLAAQYPHLTFDRSVKDVARLSFLSHDPDSWFNPNAPILQCTPYAARSEDAPCQSKQVSVRVCDKTTPYGRAVLKKWATKVASTPVGKRNNNLNAAAYVVGRFVAGGEIEESEAYQLLRDAGRESGMDLPRVEETLGRAMKAGFQNPQRAPEPETVVIENEQEPVSATDSSNAEDVIILSGVFPGGEAEGEVRPLSRQARFEVRRNGVWYMPPGDEHQPKRICSYALPVALTRDSSKNGWALMLKIRDKEGNDKIRVFPYRLFAGDGVEARKLFLDSGGEIASGRDTRTLFANFINTATPWNAKGQVQYALSVKNSGWVPERKVFVLPDGEVVGDTEEFIFLEGALEHFDRKAGTLEGWRNGVARLAGGNDLLTLVICASFAGVLLRFCGMEGAGINLQGSSTKGKTTLLKAALATWGGTTPLTWRSTLNALEGTASRHNDNLLCLDELKLSDPREAGEAAYALASGQGKGRADITGGEKERRTWRIFLLSTAEIALETHVESCGKNLQAGANLRILDIPATGYEHGCFSELHGFKDGKSFSEALQAAANSHHGWAGPEFVRQLLANLTEREKGIERFVNRFVGNLVPSDFDSQAKRGAKIFGLCAVAGEYATNMGITGWERGDAVKACTRLCEAWINARGGGGDQEERTIMEHVENLLQRFGRSKFEAPCEENHIHDRWGFRNMNEPMEDGIFYVLPGPFRTEFCKGFSRKRVLEVLTKNGIYRHPGGDRPTVQITFPQMGKHRAYRLSLISEEEATQNDQAKQAG